MKKTNRIPETYRIANIVHDTSDVFTLTLEKNGEGMAFLPGQFTMLYQFGFGEVPVSISGNPKNPNHLIHTIRAVGPVTKKMQALKKGDEIGVRGPFGASWPQVEKNSDVVVIAGGLGIAPVRPILYDLISQGHQNATLLYGTKNPSEFIYTNDFKDWVQYGIKIETTVDSADEKWVGNVGVITPLIKKNIPNPNKTAAYVCGPEIMIKFAVQELVDAGVDKASIFISLERNMQCAIGTCGHCQLGPYFVCKDGPVFSYDKIEKWFSIKEL